MLKGEPCPRTLLGQARGRRRRWSGSSLTRAKPRHPVLPVVGSGCSCNAGDVGRDIPGWLHPVAPALPPLVALRLWIQPHGLCQKASGAQGAATHPRTWARTVAGHRWARAPLPGG